MSYFNKKHVMLWVVIAVIVINFGAIGAIIYKLYQNPKQEPCRPERHCGQAYLESELHLSPAQAQEFKKLKKAHHDSVFVIHNLMREKRGIISANMVKPDPDTTLLYKTADELGMLFAQTRKLYISHYFELRKVCNPEQQEKLAGIYTKLFCQGEGCTLPQDTGCGKGNKGHRTHQGHKNCKQEPFEMN